MHKTFKKLLAVSLITSLFSAMVMNDNITFTYAGTSDATTESSDSGEYFTAMDEEGNITYIPLEEVETIDWEELEAIDSVDYEVVVAVDGEETVVTTVSTEAEAEAEVEAIQEVIDNEETVEAILQEIGIEVEDTTAAEPLEIILEDESEEESIVDETETANALTFSMNVESISTQSATSEEDETLDQEVSAVTVTTNVVTQDVEYGVLIFAAKSFTYKSEEGVEIGLAGGYAPDAAYLGTTSDETYKFMQASATGYVSTTYATVVDYDTFIAEGNIVSTYTTKNGNLYHNITTNNKTIASTQIVGYQQEYMEDNATYYSYDGYYFYTDYKTMVSDYKSGTCKNAINATAPYYNYYQYLSQRSETGFTAEQIDEYIAYKVGSSSTSKLLNTGAYFIEYQNTYGVNAILMLGVAINESASGESTIAQEKNNLFGHGAYDSNPYYGSTGYTTVTDSIKYHAEYWMSMGYTDPKDWRYFGSNLGDKSTGANVKYATDPYWGEKAAANCYLIEAYFNDATYDYGTYQIGVTSSKITLYNTPGGTEVYNSISGYNTEIDNYPVIILESVTYNDELWYKIQSDAVLSSDGLSVNRDSGVYDYDKYVVYVKADSITLAGSTDVEIPEGSLYMLGDPSGDGKISALDYMIIKNYIMGTYTLTDDNWLAADINKDDKISAIDYMMVKNHIMGISTIE
ncbi:MAG: dockerin type I domain-containing protein [Eubacteriales bacterium]